MGFCAVCNRVLYDADVRDFGPVCPDCLVKAEKEKPPEPEPEPEDDKPKRRHFVVTAHP